MEFSLNVYGPERCKIDLVDDCHIEDSLGLFKRAFMARSLDSNDWQPFGDSDPKYRDVSYTFVHGSDGYGYCAVQNKGDSTTEATITLTGLNIHFSIDRVTSNARAQVAR